MARCTPAPRIVGWQASCVDAQKGERWRDARRQPVGAGTGDFLGRAGRRSVQQTFRLHPSQGQGHGCRCAQTHMRNKNLDARIIRQRQNRAQGLASGNLLLDRNIVFEGPGEKGPLLGSSWAREGLARPSSLLKALDFDASDGFCPTQDEVPAPVCFLLGNKPGRGFTGGAVTTSRERKQLARNAQVRGGYDKGFRCAA